MAENHHAAWAAVEAERKAKRKQLRSNNVRALQAAGITFTTLNDGWQLRIEHGGKVIDFMPGVGTWSMQSDRTKRHGVRELIHYLATGALPTTEGER